MAKRLCKMNRKQIASNLGEIHRLLVAPKFVCRSCARASASKETLCKPSAIPPKSCQDKPIEAQRECGLLAEALPVSLVDSTMAVQTPISAPTSIAVESPVALDKALPSVKEPSPETNQAVAKSEAVRRVVDRVKQKKQQEAAKLMSTEKEAGRMTNIASKTSLALKSAQIEYPTSPQALISDTSLTDGKSLKKARKALKKQYKQQKQQLKLAKKQQKLLKKQQKIEKKLMKLSLAMSQPALQTKDKAGAVHVH